MELQIEFELSASAPQIYKMISLLMVDVEDSFKDRLRFGLDFIDRVSDTIYFLEILE